MELFRLQYANNPAYRRLCDSRDATPDAIGRWQDIPAAPTAAFRELENTSIAPAERSAVFHSSGTTGQKPSRHFHSRESLAVYEAALRAWFDEHFAPRGSRQVPGARYLILMPPPGEVPHSSLVHMADCLRRDAGDGPEAFTARATADRLWVLDFGRIEERVAQGSRDGTPLIVLGTAFSFVHLLDRMGASGSPLPLPPGSRVMETGGYKGRSRSVPRDELRAALARLFRIPADHVIGEYGMSELSSQAYDGRFDGSPGQPRLYRFPPWARHMIISPETGREAARGEVGLVRIWDLANVWSSMVVQTEDLGVDHGQGFELVGRGHAAEPRGCSLMAT